MAKEKPLQYCKVISLQLIKINEKIKKKIKKMWYTYTMKYYSAIKKKKEIMSFAATWMDLEITILSEAR